MSGWVRFAIVASALTTTACVGSSEARRPVRTAQADMPVPIPRQQSPRSPLPQAPAVYPQTSAPYALAQQVKALWASYEGRTGIAIMRSDGTWLIGERQDELMPQQSVSKLWVAMAVMDAIDSGKIGLYDRVTLTKSDLTVFNQPIAGMIGESGYTTTIADLLDRQMRKSDNTANDFLMRKLGGPDAIRAFISAKGLGAIRFGPGEKYLQAATAGLAWRPEYSIGTAFQKARAALPDATRSAAMSAYLANPPDGAAPAAIARALLRLKRGDLLSASSTRYLLNLMETSTTGPQRLHAGVPDSWGFAHKTGTGQDFKGRTAGFNDVAILTAPDGTSYAVVVMIAETVSPIPRRWQLMQGVSAAVAANHQF